MAHAVVIEWLGKVMIPITMQKFANENLIGRDYELPYVCVNQSVANDSCKFLFSTIAIPHESRKAKPRMYNRSMVQPKDCLRTRGDSFVVLRVLNTSDVASLDALEGQSSDQSSTNTGTILSSQDLDGVFLLGVLLLGPIKNLAQSDSTSSLEVGVLVED
jgi:hypothetical protein